jgi:hypothetical protein
MHRFFFLFQLGEELSAISFNISAALLGVARELNDRPFTTRLAGANTLQLLLQAGLELISLPTIRARRAGGELLGEMARLEGEAFSQALFTSLQKKLDPSGGRTGADASGAAFTLGCLHRSLGGLRAAKYQAFTLAALQMLGRDMADSFRPWVLHAFSLSSVSASSSFDTQAALTLLYKHAVHGDKLPPESVVQEMVFCLHPCTLCWQAHRAFFVDRFEF